MKYTFKPKGVCSFSLEFDLEGDIVRNIEFQGGCNGNLKGIAALADGMTVSQVQDKLLGIKCGFKQTSCPDQLAQAVMLAAEKEKASQA